MLHEGTQEDDVASREPNPYRPGFNQAPVVFAGRGDVLDGAAEALEVAAYDARTPRPLVLTGPRGVGKTVTLGEIASLAAAKHAWPTVQVEAKTGGSLTRDLVARLRSAALLLDGEAPTGRTRRTRVTGGSVQAKPFGIGGEVHLEVVDDGAGVDLTAELAAVMRRAVARDAGLLLTVDELQNAGPAELHELGGTLQETVPQDWPLVVVIAALPGLRITRGRRRLPTYLERAEWHRLDVLGDDDAHEALVGPAREAGRPLTRDAAAHLLALTSGYPYALQVAGHYAWRASHGRARIGLEQARAAEPRIRADLEQLFVGRWDDASPRERDYLAALARLVVAGTTPRGGGAVAAELGVRVTSVSYLRDRLLKKGTIHQDAAGDLHFITPGMADWVVAGDGLTGAPQR